MKRSSDYRVAVFDINVRKVLECLSYPCVGTIYADEVVNWFDDEYNIRIDVGKCRSYNAIEYEGLVIRFYDDNGVLRTPTRFFGTFKNKHDAYSSCIIEAAKIVRNECNN